MINFAIAGCGRIAAKHVENIRRVGMLVGVCDIIPERADEFAAATGATAYYTVDELVRADDVDVIAVCTPNGCHAEHIIKSLQAGRHVLSEKPLCLTKAAAWQIIETEKFCRRNVYIVKSARYNPIIKRLKELMDQGSLGQCYSFHLSCLWNRGAGYYTGWKGKLFPDGGTLYNQFSHYIDALIWLFGEMEDVKGFTRNAAHPAIEIEDTGAIAVQMKAGTVGTIHWSVNAFEKNHEIALTIIAEGGTVRVGGHYLNEVQYVKLADENLLPATLSFDAAQHHHHAEIYDQLIQALSASPQNGLANAYDGARTVEAIETIYKATARH